MIIVSIYIRQETKSKPSGNEVRDEKIRRMKQEKECEARLKEIHIMEVMMIWISNLQERKEKGSIVDEDLEREKWILALQSCSRKALNDLQMIPQEMEILKYMQSMKDSGKDLHKEVV